MTIVRTVVVTDGWISVSTVATNVLTSLYDESRCSKPI